MSSKFVDAYKRYIVIEIYIALAVAIAAIVYIKINPDELVAEAYDSAAVIQVDGPERFEGSTTRNRVMVELKDGTKVQFYALIGLSAVGSSVDVKVKTYESGNQKIVAAADGI